MVRNRRRHFLKWHRFLKYFSFQLFEKQHLAVLCIQHSSTYVFFYDKLNNNFEDIETLNIKITTRKIILDKLYKFINLDFY